MNQYIAIQEVRNLVEKNIHSNEIEIQMVMKELNEKFSSILSSLPTSGIVSENGMDNEGKAKKSINSQLNLIHLLREFGWSEPLHGFTSETIDLSKFLNRLCRYLHDIINDDLNHKLRSCNTGKANSFLPRIMIDMISNGRYFSKISATSVNIHPISVEFESVVLLVDISGFTKYSGQLCSQGKDGIDALQRSTNMYLGTLVDIIYAYGGDVIKFAGDALICIFHPGYSDTPVNHIAMKSRRRSSGFETEDNSNHSMLTKFPPLNEKSARKAIECAAELVKEKFENLTVHIAITSGMICFGVIGGYNDRWECLISGECMGYLSSCLDDAGSTQTVVTSSIVFLMAKSSDENLIKASCEGTSISSSDNSLSFLHLASHNFLVKPQLLDDFDLLGGLQTYSLVKTVYTAEIYQPNFRSVPSLKQCIPSTAVEVLQILDGFEYVDIMGELREVTTMFMNWDSYSTVQHRDILSLQKYFYAVQRIMKHNGGFLRQFLVDDKGCVLIACWGVHTAAFLDNAERAVRSAIKIREVFHSMDMKCSIGITTGNVYCGCVGSSLRREFAVIGDVVNLAARLMCKAKSGIYIDQATYSRTKPNTQNLFTKMEPMQLKGKADKMIAYNFSSDVAELARQLTNQTQETQVGSYFFATEWEKIVIQFLSNMASNNDHLTSIGNIRKSIDLQPNQSSKKSNRSTKVPNRFSTMIMKSMASFTEGINFLNHQPANVESFLSNPKVILVDGTIGSGKATAISTLTVHARERNFRVISIKLDPQDLFQEYVAIKKLIHSILSEETVRNASKMNKVKSILQMSGALNQDISLAASLAAVNAVCVALNINQMQEIDKDNNTHRKGGTSSSTKTMSNQAKSNSDSVRLHPGVGKTRVRNGSVMIAGVSSRMVRKLMIELLVGLLSEQKTVIILQRIHFVDEVSGESLSGLIEFLSPATIIVLTSVPEEEFEREFHALCKNVNINQPSNGKGTANQLLKPQLAISQTRHNYWFSILKDQLVGSSSTKIVNLSNYSEQDIYKILMNSLLPQYKGAVISQNLANIVHKLSGGNPYWVSEMIHLINMNGLTTFCVVANEETDDIDHLASLQTKRKSKKKADMIHSMSFFNPIKNTIDKKSNGPPANPANPTKSNEYEAILQLFIIARFEHLRQHDQLILKLASAIGYHFSTRVLFNALDESLRTSLRNTLISLVQQNWVYKQGEEDYDPSLKLEDWMRGVYSFYHSVPHRTIYDLTPTSERSKLHERIALYKERYIRTKMENEPDSIDPIHLVKTSMHYMHFNARKGLEYAVRAAYQYMHPKYYNPIESITLIEGVMNGCENCKDIDTINAILNMIVESLERHDDPFSNLKNLPFSAVNELNSGSGEEEDDQKDPEHHHHPPTVLKKKSSTFSSSRQGPSSSWKPQWSLYLHNVRNTLFEVIPPFQLIYHQLSRQVMGSNGFYKKGSITPEVTLEDPPTEMVVAVQDDGNDDDDINDDESMFTKENRSLLITKSKILGQQLMIKRLAFCNEMKLGDIENWHQIVYQNWNENQSNNFMILPI